MGLIAINGASAPYRRMPLTSSPESAEREVIGRALRMLREERDLDQADIATPLGIKAAAWSNYELGKRKIEEKRINEALAVMNATRADLEDAKARLLGTRRRSGDTARGAFVFDVFGRARAGPQGPEVYDVGEPLRRIDLGQLLGRATDALQVAGDSMSPWAESGEIVLFDRERAPRRGAGCVVELHTGEAYVKLYEKSDGSTLFVRELFPEERTIMFQLKDVKGVYPVVLRGD